MKIPSFMSVSIRWHSVETCSVLFKSSQMETMVLQNLGPCLAKTTVQSRVLPGVFGEKIRANVKSYNSQY